MVAGSQYSTQNMNQAFKSFTAPSILQFLLAHNTDRVSSYPQYYLLITLHCTTTIFHLLTILKQISQCLRAHVWQHRLWCRAWPVTRFKSHTHLYHLTGLHQPFDTFLGLSALNSVNINNTERNRAHKEKIIDVLNPARVKRANLSFQIIDDNNLQK